jgi:hypothetical protein
MLRHFRANAARAGVGLEAAQVAWHDLADFHGRTFDVVMCRGGGSYLYAGTWDKDADPDPAALGEAIARFAAMVRPGGRLYLDIMHAGDLARRTPSHTAHPPVSIGGWVVQLSETTVNHIESRTRTWRSTLVVDGTEFERRSHHIDHPSLVGRLTGAGLVEVRPESIPGEHYPAGAHRFAVIGGAQSAAEMLWETYRRFPRAETAMVTRSTGLKTYEHSRFANELYYPSFTGDFHAGAPAFRARTRCAAPTTARSTRTCWTRSTTSCTGCACPGRAGCGSSR